MKQYVNSIPGLPRTSSPYSSGVIAEGKFLFISGQGPYDPKQEKFIRGSVAEQAKLTLECLRRVIEETGASIEDVVSCRVFLQQLTEANFAELNQAYREFFGANLPARTTIGCQLFNIDVEIDCVVKLS